MSSKGVVALLLGLVCATGTAFGSDARIDLAPDLYLEPLSPGIWRHVSVKDMERWGPVAANGLVVVSGGEAALIDTAWTDEQTRRLVVWVEAEQNAKVGIVVSTHWHGDCLGGLGAAHEAGAASYASAKTIELAKAAGEGVPENGFTDKLDLSVGGVLLSLQEIGPGHTTDNFVVWIPHRKVLFTGCLVKSAKSKTMGYTNDADLDEWPHTLDRLESRFPEDAVIVPGHGAPGGRELIKRTRELIEEFVSAPTKN